MTYVSNIFNSSLNSNRKLKYFSVEVITFDGESFIEEVEARSAEEAQELKIAEYLLKSFLYEANRSFRIRERRLHDGSRLLRRLVIFLLPPKGWLSAGAAFPVAGHFRLHSA